uniref:Ladybird homeobox 2 n=1 Tax=Malurus cyaneus samueli TaxID=2593467 RepID=A0A8C5U130_9PASS
MTSAGSGGSPPLPAAVDGHRRSPWTGSAPQHHQTLTPFAHRGHLGRPAAGVPGTGTVPLPPPPRQGPRRRRAPRPRALALEELASKTFQGLELGMLQAARRYRGPSPPGASGPRPPCRKRRKSRTAFTAQQLRELEQRFRRQRYLSPVDRDALAARLALSAAQVITWFQNRRAKLKRDLEELRADVASLQALPPAALQQLAGLPEPPGAPGTGTGTAEPAELSEEEIDVAD